MKKHLTHFLFYSLTPIYLYIGATHVNVRVKEKTVK